MCFPLCVPPSSNIFSKFCPIEFKSSSRLLFAFLIMPLSTRSKELRTLSSRKMMWGPSNMHHASIIDSHLWIDLHDDVWRLNCSEILSAKAIPNLLGGHRQDRWERIKHGQALVSCHLTDYIHTTCMFIYPTFQSKARQGNLDNYSFKERKDRQ